MPRPAPTAIKMDRLPPQREVARQVVLFVLGDPDTAVQAAASLNGLGLWRDALTLAHAWHVLPQVRRRIVELGLELDPVLQLELRSTLVAYAAQAIQIARRGAEALDALGRSGIMTAAFKGLCAIGSLYSSPAERIIGDVDVLVQESDLSGACDVLRTLGYSPLLPISLNGWKQYLKTQRDVSTAFIVLLSAEGIQLDLHWRMGAPSAELMKTTEVLGRAERVPLYGLQVPVLAPFDAIAFTTFHAWRQMFAPRTTIKDVYDLRMWFEKRGDDKFQSLLMDHARACRMATPLLGLLLVLGELDPASRAGQALPALASALDAGERSEAERVARLFRFQLLRGALNPDLLALLEPVTLMQYVLERFRNRKRYAEIRSVWRKTYLESTSPSSRLNDLTREITDVRRLGVYWEIWRKGRAGGK